MRKQIKEFLAVKGSPCVIESQKELEDLVLSCTTRFVPKDGSPFARAVNKLLKEKPKETKKWLQKPLSKGKSILGLVEGLIQYEDDENQLVEIGF